MILQVQPRWMTCHSLMQFASPAGEGQERAHSIAVDGFFSLIFFLPNSHFISFLPSLWRFPPSNEPENIYITQYTLKIQNIMWLCVKRQNKLDKEVRNLKYTLHFLSSFPFWQKTRTKPTLKFRFPSYLDLIGGKVVKKCICETHLLHNAELRMW